MALSTLKKSHQAIFLSASIPTSDRAARYFDTADVIAIRDCVKALVAAVVPKFTLVWGGHPSITPMIRSLAESNPEEVTDCFVLYQSSTFKNIAPKDNEYFQHIVWVDGTDDIDNSLRVLRSRMLNEQQYVAAAFIGGMEGIEEEFSEFHKIHPDLPLFPVATTGGAAKLLFEEWRNRLQLSSQLGEETAYPFLWRRLFESLG